MGAVVDACIALRLHTLVLIRCRVMPAALPELTRLIAAGALQELMVRNNDVEMFDEANEATRLFATAVRASAMQRLLLSQTGVFPEIVREAAAFIHTLQR